MPSRRSFVVIFVSKYCSALKFLISWFSKSYFHPFSLSKAKFSLALLALFCLKYKLLTLRILIATSDEHPLSK